jgi:hypothetical protein
MLQCSIGNGGGLRAFLSAKGDWPMPGKHTSKEKRKARHIEKGYEKKGVSSREAERRAWATVNKEK